MKKLKRIFLTLCILVGTTIPASIGALLLTGNTPAFADTYSCNPYYTFRVYDVVNSPPTAYAWYVFSNSQYTDAVADYPETYATNWKFCHDITTDKYVFGWQQADFSFLWLRYDSTTKLQVNETNPDHADAQWTLDCVGQVNNYTAFDIRENVGGSWYYAYPVTSGVGTLTDIIGSTTNSGEWYGANDHGSIICG